MCALHFTIMLILDLNNYAKKVGLHDDGGLWVAIVSALNAYCVLILPRNEIALEDVVEYELNFMVSVFDNLCSNYLWPPFKGSVSPYEVEIVNPWEYTVKRLHSATIYLQITVNHIKWWPTFGFPN